MIIASVYTAGNLALGLSQREPVNEFTGWYEKRVETRCRSAEPVSTGFPYQTANSFADFFFFFFIRWHSPAPVPGVANPPGVCYIMRVTVQGAAAPDEQLGHRRAGRA
jgi:hypothetical protein